MLRDLAAGLDDRGDFEDNSSILEPCVELLAIQKLVDENSKELYPNCKKYTQLRFLVRLLHLKLLGGWTDRSFNLLLDLLLDLLNDAPQIFMKLRNWLNLSELGILVFMLVKMIAFSIGRIIQI